jgi:cation diffusion facilitator CzcD-associated flavoprotein CzcO
MLKRPEFIRIKFYEKLWKLVVRDLGSNTTQIFITPYVCVATGHHGAPTYAEFEGQDTFSGDLKEKLILQT